MVAVGQTTQSKIQKPGTRGRGLVETDKGNKKALLIHCLIQLGKKKTYIQTDSKMTWETLEEAC